MYKQSIYTITENKNIATSVFYMVLSGDTSHITASGQFVNIEIDGLYLRRPISICDYDHNTITIIYKTLGNGTEILSTMEPGSKLNLLTGLGNGFTIDKTSTAPLLVAGGVGTPPMYNLAKKLLANGVKPTVILGFTSSADVFFADEFTALGCNLYISTIDGSCGTKGMVTDIINTMDNYDYFYCCGPHPMLKAVETSCNTSGQLSFEERMGCGFGGCMGCSCQTLTGYKRICLEGPVLMKEEIKW